MAVFVALLNLNPKGAENFKEMPALIDKIIR